MYNPFDDPVDAEGDLESSRHLLLRMTAAQAVKILTEAFAASKEKQDVDYSIQTMDKLVSTLIHKTFCRVLYTIS